MSERGNASSSLFCSGRFALIALLFVADAALERRSACDSHQRPHRSTRAIAFRHDTNSHHGASTRAQTWHRRRYLLLSPSRSLKLLEKIEPAARAEALTENTSRHAANRLPTEPLGRQIFY